MAVKKRILIVLTSLLTVRNMLKSGVITDIALRDADLSVVVLGPLPQDLFEDLKATGITLYTYVDILALPTGFLDRIWYNLSFFAHKCLGPGFGFGGLVYRFNEINGFVGHQQKKRMSLARRRQETQGGNFVMARYGFPFAKSRWVYEAALKLYWSAWHVCPRIKALFEKVRPDLVFINQVQAYNIAGFALQAKTLGIPLIGYIGSWDQPSTKGPVPPHVFSRVIVQSEWMKQQLVDHHGFSPETVTAIGWPQMDPYCTRTDERELVAYRESLGLPAHAKIILFALNAERLGRDEPKLVARLAEWLEAQNAAGSAAHMILRPHPKDESAPGRYAFIKGHPQVSYMGDHLNDLAQLKMQIEIADVIINSTGSFSLDASALDKPFVYIGFECDPSVSAKESIANWYRLDHLKSVVDTEGVGVAYSFDALTEMIKAAMQNPDWKRQERAALRALHLEPLDGQSHGRLGRLILGIGKEGTHG